jgi:branched-chain amino acid transport system substrate-binding protein
MAYDCVYWLKDAIERAGSDDPGKVRDALERKFTPPERGML